MLYVYLNFSFDFKGEIKIHTHLKTNHKMSCIFQNLVSDLVIFQARQFLWDTQ